jgi:hypothetical protein
LGSVPVLLRQADFCWSECLYRENEIRHSDYGRSKVYRDFVEEEIVKKFLDKLRESDYRIASIALVIGTIIVFVIYDVLPYASRAVGDTLSEVIQDGLYSSFGLAFGWGVINGHWCWKAPDGTEMNPSIVIGLVSCVLAMVIVSAVLQRYRPFVMSNLMVFGVVSAGIFAGRYGWPLDGVK